MQIATQLATALTSQVSSSVALAPANGSDFHTALQAATTRDETPGKSTADGNATTSDKVSSTVDGQSASKSNASAGSDPAGVSAAASAANPVLVSAVPANSQPVPAFVPLVGGSLTQSTILPGSAQLAGQITPAAAAGNTATTMLPVARARLSAPVALSPEKKGKQPSSATDGSTASTTTPAVALPNTNLPVQLAALPVPLPSVAVEAESVVPQVSATVSAGTAETAMLPAGDQGLSQVAVADPASANTAAADTALANTAVFNTTNANTAVVDTAPDTPAAVSTDSTNTASSAADASLSSPAAAGQAPASVASSLPAPAVPLAVPASMPAAVSAIPVSDPRAGQEANQEAPSNQKTVASAGKKPVASTASASGSQSSVSAAKTTAQDAVPQLTALGQAPLVQAQKDHVSLPATATATTATGNTLGVADVRGKRKDNAAEGPAAAADATAAAPAAVTSRTADAQTPMQGDANDPRSTDPAAFQKILDGSQALTSASMPALAQNGSPSTTATPTANTQQDVPLTPAGASADPAVSSAVSSAQLVQSAGQSEMRVGLHSAEFGNLSISTSVNHQAISAQILTEHSELGRALAVHLPAIEEKLGAAYGLQARVEVRDDSSASRAATDSGQQGGGYQEQAGGTRDSQGRSAAASSLSSGAGANIGFLGSAAASGSSLDVPAAGSRLDIRI